MKSVSYNPGITSLCSAACASQARCAFKRWAWLAYYDPPVMHNGRLSVPAPHDQIGCSCSHYRQKSDSGRTRSSSASVWTCDLADCLQPDTRAGALTSRVKDSVQSLLLVLRAHARACVCIGVFNCAEWLDEDAGWFCTLSTR